MKRNTLGQTGLSVSEICLGTMQFGWYMDERAAFEMLDHYAEHGGNFLDTADMYSNWAPNNPGGVSEQIIGKWMKSRGNRSKIVLATKCRAKMWDGVDGEGLSRSHILRACEDSLRRLQTDFIDVYQSHWDDDWVAQEETMESFHTLVDAGKIRFAGCSNFSAARLASAQKIARGHGWTGYSTIQPHYNLVFRGEYEEETRGVCEQSGIAAIPYSPLAGGLLTGKFHTGKTPPSNRADYVKRYDAGVVDLVMPRLLALAEDLGVLPLQLALRWMMAQPTVAAPIIGASSNAQLDEILKSAESNFPSHALDELTSLSA